jgi:hypothetical protein
MGDEIATVTKISRIAEPAGNEVGLAADASSGGLSKTATDSVANIV